jgi:hypothetical protein
VSDVRVAGTFQTNELPLKPLPMVLTVLRAVAGPFLRMMVTGPVFPDQVRLKGLPAVMELKAGSVNWTPAACAATKVAAATRNFENCIFEGSKY